MEIIIRQEETCIDMIRRIKVTCRALLPFIPKGHLIYLSIFQFYIDRFGYVPYLKSVFSHKNYRKGKRDFKISQLPGFRKFYKTYQNYYKLPDYCMIFLLSSLKYEYSPTLNAKESKVI